MARRFVYRSENKAWNIEGAVVNRGDLLAVNLELLRERLIRLGWQRDDSDRSVLYTPDNQTAYLPFNEPENSKVLALESIFNYLGTQNGLLTSSTLASQVAHGQDVLFVGIDIPAVQPGRLPLTKSRSFYSRWEGFLAQSAAAESSFNAKGVRRLPRDAASLLSGVEWGQTAASSFLHALHIPLARNLEPIGRRTWHRMFRCLDSLSHAVTERDVRPILALEESGWTAPMCEMLGEMVADTQATSIKAIAAPDLTFDDLLSPSENEVTVAADPEVAIDLLAQASLSLRGFADAEESRVSGFVFSLADPSIVGATQPRTIKILWRQEGSNDLRINVEVEPEDYAIAERAYFERRELTVSGYISSRGTRYWLTSPRAFELI